MAPTVDTVAPTTSAIEQLKIAAKAQAQASALPQPLQLSGALEAAGIKYFDVTTVIGREFKDVQVRDLINAPNADELLRDLAITISQRNVVFFRNQDLTTDELKFLVHRLGQLTGKPKDSGLHIHPVINAERDGGLGGVDNEISRISNRLNNSLYGKDSSDASNKRQNLARLWHSDITFEPVPTDYSALRIDTLPETGGDTLWASGYELYDRLSPPYQKFLEGLTGTYAQPLFTDAAKAHGFKVYSVPRGSPFNVGEALTATHPIIRTNPVTGWKSVFAVGHHVAKINGLTDRESKHLLKEFVKLVALNHDLQVRFKWGKNDLAIWDNRSTYHTATEDVTPGAIREGNRTVGIAEKPYLDPNSTGRREALGEQVPLARNFA